MRNNEFLLLREEIVNFIIISNETYNPVKLPPRINVIVAKIMKIFLLFDINSLGKKNSGRNAWE